MSPLRFEVGFTSNPANLGRGPLVLRSTRRSPNVAFDTSQVLHGRGRRSERPAPVRVTYDFHPTHDHFHTRDFMRFELVAADGKRVGRGRKQGFCIGDRQPWATRSGRGQPPPAVYTGKCGYLSPGLLKLTQGLSPGWSDPYPPFVDGQSIDVTGLPAGAYDLVNRVNPDRALLEATYTDNAAAVRFDLAWPSGPGITPTISGLRACFAARCPRPGD